MNFYYPVDPSAPITQSFAQHVANALAYGWANYNGGIDWAVPTGTAVKAAKAGTVVETLTDATGYGTHVRIQHREGYLTIYAHLLSIKVSKGDIVRTGKIIGFSDNTGTSAGSHLHFELRKDEIPIDPMPFLKAAGETVEIFEEALRAAALPASAPATFPALPKAKVLVAALNIRQQPAVSAAVVGTLALNQAVPVIRTIKSGSDVWLQIGHQQYCAMLFSGSQLAAWA
ncbi:MAG: M23 family metallopeptidase [Anaerolineales bacterium]|nr:M23 family metallopeptidase [Anaerolineales bacterium]